MDLSAPWVRLSVRGLQWGILIFSLAQIGSVLLSWRRRGVRPTWDTAWYALGVCALLWAPEMLSALEARHPRVGEWATDIFVLGGVCLIAWLYFGPGRRDGR